MQSFILIQKPTKFEVYYVLSPKHYIHFAKNQNTVPTRFILLNNLIAWAWLDQKKLWALQTASRKSLLRHTYKPINTWSRNKSAYIIVNCHRSTWTAGSNKSAYIIVNCHRLTWTAGKVGEPTAHNHVTVNNTAVIYHNYIYTYKCICKSCQSKVVIFCLKLGFCS